MADVSLKARVTLQDDASKPLASFKQQLINLSQGSVGAAMAVDLVRLGIAHRPICEVSGCVYD